MKQSDVRTILDDYKNQFGVYPESIVFTKGAFHSALELAYDCKLESMADLNFGKLFGVEVIIFRGSLIYDRQKDSIIILE